jgi:hypothetical protein
MPTIEFQTRIENGAILIPEEYRDRFLGSVRVILMGEELAGDGNLIEELLAKPLKIPEFRPLTRDEIYGSE